MFIQYAHPYTIAVLAILLFAAAIWRIIRHMTGFDRKQLAYYLIIGLIEICPYLVGVGLLAAFMIWG